MSRMFQAAACALIIAACSPTAARADVWCYPMYSSSYTYPSYYYTVVTPDCRGVQPSTITYPVPVVRPGMTAVPQAQPTPAPASKSIEPPLAKKAASPPTVIESKSFKLGDDKAMVGAVDAAGKPLCRVGFWNISGRDVTLTINGKTYNVLRNNNLTVTVGRTFAWHIDDREPHSEIVPTEEINHEIVIR